MRRCIPNATHWTIYLGEMAIHHRDVLRLVCALRGLPDLHRFSFAIDAGQFLHGASVSALIWALPKRVRRLSLRLLNMGHFRGLQEPAHA